MKVKLQYDGYVRPDTKAGDVLEVEDAIGAALLQRGVAVGANQATEEAPEGDQGGEEAPTEDWTNDRIKEYAEAHEIDLSGASTKAEYLERIAAAQTE